MNSYIVVGIVIVAIGTGIGIYGQYVKSRADGDIAAIESDKKLQKIMADIESLKDSNPPPAVVAKIDEIEDEFTSWASEFNKRKGSRRVEIEKNRLNQSALEFQISERHRRFFDYACKMLERLVTAYNKQNSGTVSFSGGSVPENLYASEGRVCGIAFSSENFWEVILHANRPARENSLPQLMIFFTDKPGRTSHTDYLVITPRKDGTYDLTLSGAKVPGFVVDNKPYPMDGYEESLKLVLKNLFEAQILALP